MYNPNPSFPDQKLVQLKSETEGGALELYPSGDHPPDPCIYMGIEPSPFHTGKLEFFDPDGAMPHDPYIRMGLEPTPFLGAKFEMYDPGSGWADQPMIYMGTEPSPFHKSRLLMYNPQLASNPQLLELSAGETEGGGWGSMLAMYRADGVSPSPEKLFELTCSDVDGARMNIYNEINKYMGLEPMPFNTGGSMKLYASHEAGPSLQMEMTSSTSDGPSLNIYDNIGAVMGLDPSPFNSGYSIKLYDPTLGSDLICMNSSYGTKASEASFKMYNPGSEIPESTLVDITADGGTAVFRLGQSNTLTGPMSFVYSEANGNTSHHIVRGGQVYDNLGPVIMMTADQTEAKVGIGHADSPEALYVVGNIVATGTIMALTDTRAKTNVARITNALGIVKALNGVRYDWNDEAKSAMHLPETRQIGLIAQDVEKVLPEIVLSPEDDGYKAVDYSRLTAVLIEAVKELAAENDELKKRIEKLEGR